MRAWSWSHSPSEAVAQCGAVNSPRSDSVEHLAHGGPCLNEGMAVDGDSPHQHQEAITGHRLPQLDRGPLALVRLDGGTDNFRTPRYSGTLHRPRDGLEFGENSHLSVPP